MDGIVLAHGLGGRSDLPVDLSTAVYGAVAALLVSFAALSFFWKEPRFTGSGGRPLPAGMQRFLGSRLLDRFVKLVGLLAFVALIGVAWFGSSEIDENPAPAWLYVWLWVGLLPVSLLLGPAVKALSPLRTIAAGISTLLPGVRRPLPESWGMWPASISLLSFVWLELVYRDASAPRVVAVYLTLYSVVHVICGVLFGQRWFERGEGFEAYSTLVGRMAPLASTGEGTWVLRNPMHGLALTPVVSGSVALVSVLLGSTAFDGVTRTPFWKDFRRGLDTDAGYLAGGSAGLIAAVLAVAGIYLVAMRLTRAWLPERPTLAADFVHSLVPIAVGYTVAHYFSFAFYEGQTGWFLGSDPLNLGWDLYGAADGTVDYAALNIQVIALVQVAAIALGHITGVIVAHDRAVALFPQRSHQLAQYPLLSAMVGFTMAGIALVVGSKDSFWLLVTVAIFMPVAALFVWIMAPVDDTVNA
ncbi:MAG: hypothetical protein ACRCYQ_03985 [Nocardioides sp.]